MDEDVVFKIFQWKRNILNLGTLATNLQIFRMLIDLRINLSPSVVISFAGKHKKQTSLIFNLKSI